MRGIVRSATAVMSVATVLFMVFVLTAGSVATASPTPATGASQTVWAYGIVKSVSVGPQRALDGWTYQGSATVGYSVILNQTNTSSSTFELSVQRTMGVLFFVEYCLPSCSSPREFSNLTFHAWETVTSSANFTTSGTVLENGGPVPAIALLDTSSQSRANVTEASHSLLPGVGPLPGANTAERSKYLSANVLSASSVRFGSPLGIIPLDLASAQQWSSNASFNATGTADFSYYAHSQGPVENSTLGPASGHYSISPSGNVTLEGLYSPSDTVTFGGVTYPALQITIIGPFSVREGFILIPSQADLFGSTSQPWSASQNGTSSVSMSALDARASVGGHLGIAASSWFFDLASANPADVVGGTGGLTPASTSATNPVSSESIQGQPQSVSQATGSSQCLTTGSGCPASGGGGGPNLHNLFVAAIGGAVVVVVAVLAIVLVTERRRMPPPAYPNANLYPPGAARSPPGSSGFRAPGAPATPPAEEDPLDHLW
jgi:hypothetical protein